ncbi:unnamed protein product [Diatraea saccharalis]|uniref:Uncharacterized protein n=1 Tax=Diatraea saccharalis TaxID=40085 RepID=A0A9N9R470_9NEOP|nr:unnamed protein product [Diatraea saccharalis]
MPTACHKPQCHSTHIANDQKIQRNVFRTLVTSEMLSQVFFSSLAPTNLYVFIKKKNLEIQEDVLNGDNFISTSGCRIPRNSKIVVLDFRSDNSENVSCCSDFQVFGESISQNFKDLQIEDMLKDNEDEFNEIESTDDTKWYQSSYVMKGFKDCVVNGTSVTTSWQE